MLPSTASTDRRAVTILGIAVNATSGVQTSAVIRKTFLSYNRLFSLIFMINIFAYFFAVTRLSQYVDKVGCTPRVQSALRQTLNEQYGGSTTAMVNALRSLDVWYTNVQALGACLVQATSASEAGGVSAARGEGGS